MYIRSVLPTIGLKRRMQGHGAVAVLKSELSEVQKYFDSPIAQSLSFLLRVAYVLHVTQQAIVLSILLLEVFDPCQNGGVEEPGNGISDALCAVVKVVTSQFVATGN